MKQPVREVGSVAKASPAGFQMKKIFLLFLVLCLGGWGCAPGESGAMGRAGLADVAHTENALQVCAGGQTLFGIDVSYYQGDINWPEVKAAGVQYAIMRVSHSLIFEDPKFEEYWAAAEAQGIPRGAYQYFEPDEDPIAQADLLLDKLAAHGQGELPPVIDVESDGGLPPATVASKVGQWIDHVENALGVKPIIYTGFYFWRDNVGGSTAFSQYPLWHAQYSDVACPTIADAWEDWAFWQTSGSGSVSGISANVDLNQFNGSLEDLLQLAGPVDYAA
jgi:lysozyme